jgi:hypothetical protein
LSGPIPKAPGFAGGYLPTIVHIPFAIDQSRAADGLPAFDIAQNCKAEGTGSVLGVGKFCVKEENDAKDQLVKSWSGFSASAKRSCVGESTVGGDQSYIELLTCLEMSRGGKFSKEQ